MPQAGVSGGNPDAATHPSLPAVANTLPKFHETSPPAPTQETGSTRRVIVSTPVVAGPSLRCRHPHPGPGYRVAPIRAPPPHPWSSLRHAEGPWSGRHARPAAHRLQSRRTTATAVAAPTNRNIGQEHFSRHYGGSRGRKCRRSSDGVALGGRAVYPTAAARPPPTGSRRHASRQKNTCVLHTPCGI